jgi:hypothetical protein
MVLTTVTLNPTPSNLPGYAELQKLANGLDGWALLAALIALIIGAVVWALGAHSQNIHQSMVGRRSVLTAILAAILIGAAPMIINFFFSAGSAAHG